MEARQTVRGQLTGASGALRRTDSDMPQWLRDELPPPKRRERLPPPAQQARRTASGCQLLFGLELSACKAQCQAPPALGAW